jgi:hypothetical protein
LLINPINDAQSIGMHKKWMVLCLLGVRNGSGRQAVTCDRIGRVVTGRDGAWQACNRPSRRSLLPALSSVWSSAAYSGCLLQACKWHTRHKTKNALLLNIIILTTTTSGSSSSSSSSNSTIIIVRSVYQRNFFVQLCCLYSFSSGISMDLCSLRII